MTSAPCSRAIAASAWTGFSTPVDVSACTIATTSAGVASSARRSASGSHALPHSTSSRVTVRAVPLAHLREPIAEVARRRRRATRVPSRTRFATTVSMPDVPVPDTANANEPSGARNRRPSRARTSSSSASMIGSRWLTVGDAIARITRGAVRLGPGPSRMRSYRASRLMRSPAGGRAPPSAQRTPRRTPAASGGRGTPTSKPTSLKRRLQAGDAAWPPSSRASGTSRRCSARASSWRACRVSVEEAHARVGQRRRRARGCRRHARRRARRRTSTPSREHLERRPACSRRDPQSARRRRPIPSCPTMFGCVASRPTAAASRLTPVTAVKL